MTGKNKQHLFVGMSVRKLQFCSIAKVTLSFERQHPGTAVAPHRGGPTSFILFSLYKNTTMCFPTFLSHYLRVGAQLYHSLMAISTGQSTGYPSNGSVKLMVVPVKAK